MTGAEELHLKVVEARRDELARYLDTAYANLALVLARAEAAERALAEVREALRPLAAVHGSVRPDRMDEEEVCIDVTIGDVRRARRVLAASPGPNNAEKEGAGRGENAASRPQERER
jgi:hypothetical protein